jgi:hypothetical protein
MLKPHRIRLRKPWQFQAGPRGACWQRRFGAPTGLGAAETVWLAVEGLAAAGTVEINGQPLGSLSATDGRTRFDVTGRLADRNEVSIVLAGPAKSPLFATATSRGDFPGEVYLEIVSAPNA